jgi:hypothetical protein
LEFCRKMLPKKSSRSSCLALVWVIESNLR